MPVGGTADRPSLDLPPWVTLNEAPGTDGRTWEAPIRARGVPEVSAGRRGRMAATSGLLQWGLQCLDAVLAVPVATTPAVPTCMQGGTAGPAGGGAAVDRASVGVAVAAAAGGLASAGADASVCVASVGGDGSSSKNVGGSGLGGRGHAGSDGSSSGEVSLASHSLVGLRGMRRQTVDGSVARPRSPKWEAKDGEGRRLPQEEERERDPRLEGRGEDSRQEGREEREGLPRRRGSAESGSSASVTHLGSSVYSTMTVPLLLLRGDDAGSMHASSNGGHCGDLDTAGGDFGEGDARGSLGEEDEEEEGDGSQLLHTRQSLQGFSDYFEEGNRGEGGTEGEEAHGGIGRQSSAGLEDRLTDIATIIPLPSTPTLRDGPADTPLKEGEGERGGADASRMDIVQAGLLLPVDDGQGHGQGHRQEHGQEHGHEHGQGHGQGHGLKGSASGVSAEQHGHGGSPLADRYRSPFAGDLVVGAEYHHSSGGNTGGAVSQPGTPPLSPYSLATRRLQALAVEWASPSPDPSRAGGAASGGAGSGGGGGGGGSGDLVAYLEHGEYGGGVDEGGYLMLAPAGIMASQGSDLVFAPGNTNNSNTHAATGHPQAHRDGDGANSRAAPDSGAAETGNSNHKAHAAASIAARGASRGTTVAPGSQPRRGVYDIMRSEHDPLRGRGPGAQPGGGWSGKGPAHGRPGRHHSQQQAQPQDHGPHAHKHHYHQHAKTQSSKKRHQQKHGAIRALPFRAAPASSSSSSMAAMGAIYWSASESSASESSLSFVPSGAGGPRGVGSNGFTEEPDLDISRLWIDPFSAD
eukprot:jgi/Mesvir1/28518/Mv13035-RA.1